MDNGQRGHNYHWGGLQRAQRDDDDYEEADVWDVLHDHERAPTFYYEDKVKGLFLKNRESDIKLIPRPEPGSGTSRVQKSAPVNISYWPKKLNAGGASSSPRKKMKEARDDSVDDDDDEKGESDEEGDCSDFSVPPHEFIARRHISSFSVFEGVGRKLKGRDLSNVRHAVLTRTGFLRSP